MSRLAPIRPLLGLLLVCPPLGADTPRGDEKQIQGKWAVVSFQDAGRRTPAPKPDAVVIEGNKLKITEGGREQEITFTLDPSQKLKHIDLTAPRNKDKVNLGIYELDGDKLKICFNAKPGGERSTAFESKRDTPNTVLIVLKRDKE